MTAWQKLGLIATDMAVFGIFIAVLTALAVGIWGFVEGVQWLTSLSCGS